MAPVANEVRKGVEAPLEFRKDSQRKSAIAGLQRTAMSRVCLSLTAHGLGWRQESHQAVVLRGKTILVLSDQYRRLTNDFQT